MPQCRAILVFMLALTLAGCASTKVDLVPLSSTEGAVKVSDDGVSRLQVQVQNQGSVFSPSSPVAVTFLLNKTTVTSAIQDGGGLEPGESSRVLEFEIPELCLEEGCEFQVSVDPNRRVSNEDRANNMVPGQLERQIASKHTRTLESPQPTVQ